MEEEGSRRRRRRRRRRRPCTSWYRLGRNSREHAAMQVQSGIDVCVCVPCIIQYRI